MKAEGLIPSCLSLLSAGRGNDPSRSGSGWKPGPAIGDLEMYDQNESAQAYIDAYKEFEDARAKIRQLKQVELPNWYDYLVKPLETSLNEVFPEADVECLGPFGLGCKVSIYVGESRKRQFSMTVFPGNLDEGKLFVEDRTTVITEYPKGSLGAINELGFASNPLPPFEELVEQIKEELEKEAGNE